MGLVLSVCVGETSEVVGWRCGQSTSRELSDTCTVRYKEMKKTERTPSEIKNLPEKNEVE